MKCRMFYLKHSRRDWLWRPAMIKVEIDAMPWLMLQAPSLCLIPWFLFTNCDWIKLWDVSITKSVQKYSTVLLLCTVGPETNTDMQNPVASRAWKCWLMSIQYGTFVFISHGMSYSDTYKLHYTIKWMWLLS